MAEAAAPRAAPTAEPGVVPVWLPLLRETLARTGRFRWRLSGHSMLPTLPAACEIEMAPLPARLWPGDLVVFAAGELLVAHRLVRRCGGRWLAQGDGCPRPDGLLGRERMVGVVVAAYARGRRCWPRPMARLAALRWVARYYGQAALRRVRRDPRRGLGRSTPC